MLARVFGKIAIGLMIAFWLAFALFFYGLEVAPELMRSLFGIA